MVEEVIAYRWQEHFLRDDRASGIADYERYSLFRVEPYGREMVLAGRLEWAKQMSDILVREG